MVGSNIHLQLESLVWSVKLSVQSSSLKNEETSLTMFKGETIVSYEEDIILLCV